jgi:hypothetical protein
MMIDLRAQFETAAQAQEQAMREYIALVVSVR